MRRRTLFPIVLVAGVLVAGFHVGPAATDAVPVPQPLKSAERITCAANRHFLLRTDAERAQIQIGNRRLELQRAPSAISQRYRSEEATLMLDGEFIAFVPKGDAGWTDCRHARIAPASIPKG
ncbi:hypothetical protein [Novosphingobium gossypii]|uniref:hypothetical protein n=1 Tax=Novosphingobium gossypii TaxID=1604774 RepID=UPI003D23BE7E